MFSDTTPINVNIEVWGHEIAVIVNGHGGSMQDTVAHKLRAKGIYVVNGPWYNTGWSDTGTATISSAIAKLTLDPGAALGREYGWYNMFRPQFYEQRHRSKLGHSGAPHQRAQRQQVHNARERARWNRRKFLHGLRVTRTPAGRSRPTHSYSTGLRSTWSKSEGSCAMGRNA